MRFVFRTRNMVLVVMVCVPAVMVVRLPLPPPPLTELAMLARSQSEVPERRPSQVAGASHPGGPGLRGSGTHQ